MERRIIVMRHAKSSWSSPARTDHERPLNQRGRRDAPRVGAALAKRGWLPDLVLSSDSMRTRETFAGLTAGSQCEPRVEFFRSFYGGGPDEVLEELAAVPEDLSCVLVLGHNPGWEMVVHALCGKHIVMKTATAALLSRDPADWHLALNGIHWTLEDVIYPREL
jgi:phosphohistidine phosphatase